MYDNLSSRAREKVYLYTNSESAVKIRKFKTIFTAVGLLRKISKFEYREI